MADSVDPDKMAHNEPSHLDVHCLQKNQSPSTGGKGLSLRPGHQSHFNFGPVTDIHPGMS